MLDTWLPHIPQLIAKLLYGINNTALNNRSKELSLKIVTLHTKYLKAVLSADRQISQLEMQLPGA